MSTDRERCAVVSLSKLAAVVFNVLKEGGRKRGGGQMGLARHSTIEEMGRLHSLNLCRMSCAVCEHPHAMHVLHTRTPPRVVEALRNCAAGKLGRQSTRGKEKSQYPRSVSPHVEPNDLIRRRSKGHMCIGGMRVRTYVCNRHQSSTWRGSVAGFLRESRGRCRPHSSPPLGALRG